MDWNLEVALWVLSAQQVLPVPSGGGHRSWGWLMAHAAQAGLLPEDLRQPAHNGLQEALGGIIEPQERILHSHREIGMN